MKKKIFKRLLSLTATAVFAVGAISSHAYYVETNEELLGEAVFNLDVEDAEAFTEVFTTMNSCSIVDAAEEGIPAASAHGKVVKGEKVTAGTYYLNSNYQAIGNKDNIPEGDELSALKRVAFSVDVFLPSALTGNEQLVLLAYDVKKDSNGKPSNGNNSKIISFAYGTKTMSDGIQTSAALEVLAHDYNNEGASTQYRIAEWQPKQWYTITILYDVTDGDNPKQWIWIDDELVADEFGYHRTGGSTGNKTEFICGLRVQSQSSSNTEMYFDNFQMWKDVQVDEFLATFKNDDPSDDAIKTYDGYQSSYSVTTSEAAASVQFDILSYMDLNRPAVALAAVYDKRTNTVGTVYYKPLNLIMAKPVSDSIENIALPEDYNENDYEIKLYIWDRGDIFAPVFIPVAQ